MEQDTGYVLPPMSEEEEEEARVQWEIDQLYEDRELPPEEQAKYERYLQDYAEAEGY